MGIKEIRKLEAEYHEAFAKMESEYLSMRTRDFCNLYRIGVTSAVKHFGRKKKETREDPNAEYRQLMKEIEAERRNAKRHKIEDDIDPYYR